MSLSSDGLVAAAVGIFVAIWILATVFAISYSSRKRAREQKPPPPPPLDPSLADLDPLDAAGKLPNQFTRKKNSCDWGAQAAKWATLPVYADKTKLKSVMDSIESNNVTMIVSGTGSGKTVIVPKLCHRLLNNTRPSVSFADSVALWAAGKRAPGSVVATTNPKQIPTAENAKYAAELSCVRLGSEIGYRYRDSPKEMASRSTELEYVTDGQLLAIANADPLFSEYGMIVVDEVHERGVPTDFLLLALKKAMVARPDLRAVIMSATMDTAPFVRWFESEGLKVGDISISGAPNFPIERVHVALNRGETAINKAIEIAFGIHKSKTSRPGGIVIFVTSKAEVGSGCFILNNYCAANGLTCSSELEGGDPDIRCLKLFSGVSDIEKEVAQRESGSRSTRNVIFATNVAESSLTVKGLSYVIDTGKAFRSRYDAVTDTVVSMTDTITKAEAIQRIGRVGRIGPGVAYLLYPERVFEKMQAHPPPAIATTDVSGQMFDMFASRDDWTWRDLEAFVRDMLTPPSTAQMSVTRSRLLFYGLIDSRGLKTPVGQAVYFVLTTGRLSLSDAIFMLAAQLSSAVDAAATTVLSAEVEANAVYGRRLADIGIANLCPHSEHQTLRATLSSAMFRFPIETMFLKERLAEIASAARSVDLGPVVYSGLWPWNWLFRKWFNPIGALCSDAVFCTGRPVSLTLCDAYYRSVLVANLVNGVRTGKRMFGNNAKPAKGPSTFPISPGAVLVGSAFRSGRDSDSLVTCTAFDPRSVEELLKTMPRF